MSRQVDTRVAGMENVARLVELNRALFREDAGWRDDFTDQSWPEERGKSYFTGFLGRDRSLCLLAESAEEVVDYLAGYIREGTPLRPVAVAELQSVYVVERYRNLGLRSRLVDEFSEWVATEGVDPSSVMAYATNEQAIRFYKRHGFHPLSMTLERSVQ